MSDKKLGTGIKRIDNGYRVYVKVQLGGGLSELRTKRFPITAKKSEMDTWREEQRADARANPVHANAVRGTLAADVADYLRQVAAMKSIDFRRRDLQAWIDVFGDMARHKITAAMIRAQLHTWRTIGPVYTFNPKTKERIIRRDDNGKPLGLSASACNHRRTALLHVWSILDGKSSRCPVREVKKFTEPPPAPRARDLGKLDAAISLLRNPKQRARARVMLWTGIRGNCELAPMTEQNLDLDHAVCYVPTAKLTGSAPTMRTVPLTVDGVAAWREFIAANAWGPYDKNALLKSIARACDKLGMSGVRTYDLRHSIATAYRRGGADLADVQALLGQTTARMTQRYAPFSPDKLRAVGATLGLGKPAPTTTPKPEPTDARVAAAWDTGEHRCFGPCDDPIHATPEQETV